MKRTLTTVALSVLLLVPLAWWRGRTHAHGVALVTPAGNVHAVGFHRGRLMMFLSDVSVRPPHNAGIVTLSSRTELFDVVVDSVRFADATRLNRLGISITTGSGPFPHISPVGPRTLIVLPPWIICLVASAVLVAPTLRRGVRPGHCHACGYDLRASGGVCPECGAARASERMLAASAPSDMLSTQ